VLAHGCFHTGHYKDREQGEFNHIDHRERGMETGNGNRNFDRIYRMDRMGVFAHGQHGEIIGGELPPGLEISRLISLNLAWSGLVSLNAGIIFCVCTRVFPHGHHGEARGGIWATTGRTGTEFRADWFAQMPRCTALYRRVPVFFRKFYPWCLHTGCLRTAIISGYLALSRSVSECLAFSDVYFFVSCGFAHDRYSEGEIGEGRI
jgi:hypothetical protein